MVLLLTFPITGWAVGFPFPGELLIALVFGAIRLAFKVGNLG